MKLCQWGGSGKGVAQMKFLPTEYLNTKDAGFWEFMEQMASNEIKKQPF